jgi:archaellum component FlaC
MPGKTTRLDTGQYLYKTPKGDFILQRSANRRYLRGEGQRGKHVTDWSVVSAPDKYRRQAAAFSEIGKGLLMDKIDELVATNYEELHEQVKRLQMEQEKRNRIPGNPANLDDLTRMGDQLPQQRYLVVKGPDGTETRIGISELERQIKDKNNHIAALKKELGKQNNQRLKQLETITTLINQLNGLNNTIAQLTQTVSKSQEMIQKLVEKSQDQPPRRTLNWAATRREQIPEDRQQLIHQWLNGLSDQDLNRVRNEWMHRHTPEPQATQDEDRPAG